MRDPCEIHVSTCRSMRAVGSQRLRSVADGSTLRSTPPAAAALALHRAGRRERDGLQSWRAEMLERICRRAVASHISQRAVQHRCMGRDTASTVCFRRKSYFYFKVRNERPENGRCSRCHLGNFLRGGGALPARSRCVARWSVPRADGARLACGGAPRRPVARRSSWRSRPRFARRRPRSRTGSTPSSQRTSRGAVGRRGSAALERPGAAPAGAAEAGGQRGGCGVLAVGGGLEGHQRGPAPPARA